jgi:hypothetical protein
MFVPTQHTACTCNAKAPKKAKKERFDPGFKGKGRLTLNAVPCVFESSLAPLNVDTDGTEAGHDPRPHPGFHQEERRPRGPRPIPWKTAGNGDRRRGYLYPGQVLSLEKVNTQEK